MNRKIIITGSNNGIGLGMTQSLLEMGDRVAALDLTLENLTPPHPNLLPKQCDITNPQRVQFVVDEVLQSWNGVDVLINNACLALFKLFSERTLDDIRREFEVNYFGSLNLIQAVLPIMCKQGQGIIHNVSSRVGFTGMPGMTGYTSIKGALEAFTRTLALELAEEGIIVNVLHPSLTRTKSAVGFGVPTEMMADPRWVGQKLARQVGLIGLARVVNGSWLPGFSIPFSRGLGPAPAGAALRLIEIVDVSVDVGQGSPIPVEAIVSGTWPDLCAHLAQVEQRIEDTRFEVSLLASPFDPTCHPNHLGLPFRFAIPLNMVE
jgi:NAD(P)-dependent dehydrogenase (short-subunit alcohol dehydrogenase family)